MNVKIYSFIYVLQYADNVPLLMTMRVLNKTHMYQTWTKIRMHPFGKDKRNTFM